MYDDGDEFDPYVEPSMSQCNQRMRLNKAAIVPRTCALCGLGPCRYNITDNHAADLAGADTLKFNCNLAKPIKDRSPYCEDCGGGPCHRLSADEAPHDGKADTASYCVQYSPFPGELAALVEALEYRPGWVIKLEDKDRGQGSRGLTLVITTKGYDSYNPGNGETYRVNHYMPVPPAAFNRVSWQHWLFDQCVLVERHECMEFFRINGKRPYAPHHGPGNDPYIVFERGSDEEARTMYTGEINKPAPKVREPITDNDKNRLGGAVDALKNIGVVTREEANE